ncbi:MAG: radical SAM protein [Desulfobacterales bacterium]|nr:radical SAM protein [Desulfobacterales bacterium]
MILLIEPISKNTDMYVPAYPLPIMEVGSFVKSMIPEMDLAIISMPVDYGLPLTRGGKEKIYQELLKDLAEMKPRGVGISCTAIAQAEEVIALCECIKAYDPDIFIFLGGYFPTIYYEEIFSRTSTVDAVVIGEGEISALKICENLEKGKNPLNDQTPNLAWKENGKIRLTKRSSRFDLGRKAVLNLELLRYPRGYTVLPYAFSRGCSYHCNFCMEEFIRPHRREVPPEIIRADLNQLSRKSKADTLLISDALFKSFALFPFLRTLGMKVNFETRCDVLDPSIIPGIADGCGIIALGVESASYDTLRRMNKVKDRAHYNRYISNAFSIFREAVRNEIPIMVFMIAGYPGDREEDLEESLLFAQELAKESGPGGHVFKIGECRVYPKTKTYEFATSTPDVVFDDQGVFGENIVRQPSKDLDFNTVLAYMNRIFTLSNLTPKLDARILDMMPFFRIPSKALKDETIPDACFRGLDREILDVKRESLSDFRGVVHGLREKYKDLMSRERETRNLSL